MSRTVSPAALNRVVEFAASDDPADWRRAARSKHCPPDLLADIANRCQDRMTSSPEFAHQHATSLAYAAAVSNPACPPHIVASALMQFIEPDGLLMSWSGVQLALAAARNPALSTEQIAQALDTFARLPLLGADEWRQGGPSAKTLPHMSQVHWVCHALLAHPNTTTDTLRAWLTAPTAWREHFSWDQSGIAENPNCPADLQLILARHRLAKVRKSLAQNPNLTDEAAAILAADATASVRARMIRAGRADANLLAASLDHTSTLVRAAVAATTDDPDSLTRLAMDSRDRIRKRATSNPAAPEEAHIAAALMAGGR